MQNFGRCPHIDSNVPIRERAHDSPIRVYKFE